MQAAILQQQGATKEIDPSTILLFATDPTGKFNATDSISSLLLMHNITEDVRYVLARAWCLLVSGGNITYFKTNFTMIAEDGTQCHVHSISNFIGNVFSPLILDILRATFTGETVIRTDCNITWYALQTTVTIP